MGLFIVPYFTSLLLKLFDLYYSRLKTSKIIEQKNKNLIMNLLKFDYDIPEIGLRTRKKTAGKELDLVEEYCSGWVNDNEADQAIFIEPKIGNSFPDIVIVEYRKEQFTKWNEERNNIQKRDLKILNYIYNSEGITSNDLIKKLGYNSKHVLSTIEKLIDSQILYRDEKKWKTVDGQVFGIKSIKAIEAKLDDLSHAFKQAKLNKWFASESYVLTNTERPIDKTINTSEDYGVGLFSLSKNGFIQKINATRQRLPLSHASWYFNEWIGRYTFKLKS